MNQRCEHVDILVLAALIIISNQHRCASEPAFKPVVLGEQKPSTVKGTVSQFLLTPRGDADGLILTNGIQIHFPPHLGNQLARTVKVHDMVTARGASDVGPVFTAREIINDETSQAVVDTGPPPSPPKPPTTNTRSLKTTSTIKTWLYGPKGDLNGFVLANRCIVRMPPETIFRFENSLPPGQLVSVEGTGCENVLGECIEATALGIGKHPVIPIYANHP